MYLIRDFKHEVAKRSCHGDIDPVYQNLDLVYVAYSSSIHTHQDRCNFQFRKYYTQVIKSKNLSHDQKLSSSNNFPPKVSEMAGKTGNVVAVDFTVFGKVQGVFFRKHTMSKAKELGLRGFCLNTSEGTVTGTIEGPSPQIKTMKTWLEKTGSPKSKIIRTEFGEERSLTDFTFSSFQIQK